MFSDIFCAKTHISTRGGPFPDAQSVALKSRFSHKVFFLFKPTFECLSVSVESVGCADALDAKK